nr:threonylcarbamoyl-amp synthase [Quercus suber]
MNVNNKFLSWHSTSSASIVAARKLFCPYHCRKQNSWRYNHPQRFLHVKHEISINRADLHNTTMDESSRLQTSTLAVNPRKIGRLTAIPLPQDLLDGLEIELNTDSEDAESLSCAAEQLKTSDIPVAFPTETVYGLGADATRSAAVKGIYKAKQRPADNPLIVHVASLKQLRAILEPSKSQQLNGDDADNSLGSDSIPDVYKPLIKRFWPGPLTIILRNPRHSLLAPEVTAGLDTFGARMPKDVLALALIHLAGVPLAAPSANASTKPSPTAAEHVAYDLDGRIRTIIDGGPCDVGVESTVVDGLSQPPLILRPGGISLEQLRTCPGWEDTEIGYKNVSEIGSQPRAPGMKYRHYAPKAKVVLFESSGHAPSNDDLLALDRSSTRIGLVRTKTWSLNTDPTSDAMLRKSEFDVPDLAEVAEQSTSELTGIAGLLQSLDLNQEPRQALQEHTLLTPEHNRFRVLDIALGRNTTNIARWIFSALRELDRENVDMIVVEGIDDAEGDIAAAVMNRLRKAAEVHVTSS